MCLLPSFQWLLDGLCSYIWGKYKHSSRSTLDFPHCCCIYCIYIVDCEPRLSFFLSTRPRNLISYLPCKMSVSSSLCHLQFAYPVAGMGFVALYFLYFSQGPWRIILWEMNVGLFGLGVSLGKATNVLTGAKTLTRNPHPDFPRRCRPDRKI